MEYSSKTIGGKTVYIVEKHHQALIPWGIERQTAEQPPVLITFDYHTDTRPAFLHYAFQASGEDEQKAAILRHAMASTTNYTSDKLIAYVAKLRNDEHIDCAIKTGIIKDAFVFSFEGDTTWSIQERKYWEDDSPQGVIRRAKTPPPAPPYTFEEPANKIFIIKTGGVGIESANRVINADFLANKFASAMPMAVCAGINNLLEYPFILDIDLDCFTTKKSICPDNVSFFHLLIRKSQFITIAEEPDFVIRHRIEADIDSAYLLKQLLQHIENALL